MHREHIGPTYFYLSRFIHLNVHTVHLIAHTRPGGHNENEKRSWALLVQGPRYVSLCVSLCLSLSICLYLCLCLCLSCCICAFCSVTYFASFSTRDIEFFIHHKQLALWLTQTNLQDVLTWLRLVIYTLAPKEWLINDNNNNNSILYDRSAIFLTHHKLQQ